MEKHTQESYTPPEFWSFRPFFTLQPVVSTRDKQLKLWKELILQFCIQNNLHRLIPSSFPYFKNASLDRELSSEGIHAVISYIIRSGNAEWEDSAQTSLRIIWKTPEALAGEIYQWALKEDLIGSVSTVYELHSGEENQDSGFHGCDPVILRRALELLQNNDKCRILKGSSNDPDEDGVKFLATT
mmetsp:Transcript_10924/g.17793  ORF Transcript_10924/g.17793 Transcript_10924/m.17793 type:complete len:185 (+) Transcript_10924:69-623(+)